MTNGRFDWFRLAAWVPPLALAAAFAYVAGYDGWGRWSAAPLLLVPVLLSLPITLAGLVRIRSERAWPNQRIHAPLDARCRAPPRVAPLASRGLPLRTWEHDLD